MNVRSPKSLLVLLALATGLSACGAASDNSTAVLTPASLANIASKTTAKGGVRMTMDQTMSLGSEGAIPTRAEGVFDTKTKRGEMTMTMDLSAISGGDQLPAGAGREHVILDGLTFYMSSPLFSANLPAGKKWLKLDLDKLGKSVGIDFGSLTQGAGQDPTQSLNYLKAASGDVTKVGSENVRGEPTTHYKATIDFNRVPDSAPADQRAAMRKSIRQIIKLAGASTAPMEVWIDKDGIVRRMSTTIATKIGGQRGTIRQRMELYDFGTKVDVQVPDASQTVDAGDLGGSSGGGIFG
jgi:hypothetical protein